MAGAIDALALGGGKEMGMGFQIQAKPYLTPQFTVHVDPGC
jgi:hypothetical protein